MEICSKTICLRAFLSFSGEIVQREEIWSRGATASFERWFAEDQRNCRSGEYKVSFWPISGCTIFNIWRLLQIYRFSQAQKRSSRSHDNDKFLFVLSWLPWTSKLFMLYKTRVAIRFRAKKTLTTDYPKFWYTWVGIPVVRSGCRCTVTWLLNFFRMGSLPHFLTHGAPLRMRFARESSAIRDCK